MADTPKRLQLSRRAGYRKPEGAVVVARPSRWGNPYSVAEHGQASAVDRHRVMVGMAIGNAARNGWPHPYAELRNRDLACWCRLCPEHAEGKPLGVECSKCAPCHADVLMEAANG